MTVADKPMPYMQNAIGNVTQRRESGLFNLYK
eukprot:CAMPEP_0202960258 /NCGR_PEP_ID=MMETSP1396-20130829/4405_1 /ASSEMBLY_ACC=CAM_ASM_000872 /TAXON_ID= /ORGANISM="Pseudokeronopsis sp., Strain Brazil" /LENGTH=31 /DNA_ID= /DNA_START= /DNA_END= /DNA_ORIENTATION=